MTLFLTDSLGVSDARAGHVYAARGVVSSFALLVSGPLIDRWGAHQSLAVGASLVAAGRVAVVFAHTNWLAVTFFITVLQSIGAAFMGPALAICIRRGVSSSAWHPAAYALFYSTMNAGALAAGTVTDILFRTHASAVAPFVGAALASIAALTIVVVFPVPAAAATTIPSPDNTSHSPVARSWRDSVRHLMLDTNAWLCVGFMTALFWIRTPFMHMDATFPKYAERVFGHSVDFGLLYAINPTLIIVGVPFIQSYVVRFDMYAVITTGTVLAAISPLAVAVWPTYVAGVAAFMITLSLGEAIYSPMTYTYIMALAPVGREGVYATVSAAPSIVGAFIVGSMSGHLLADYCPAPDPRHSPLDDAIDPRLHAYQCARIWIVVAALAAITPFTLVLARRHLYPASVRDRCQHRHSETADSIDVY